MNQKKAFSLRVKEELIIFKVERIRKNTSCSTRELGFLANYNWIPILNFIFISL